MRLKNSLDVETETHRDSEILRMLRPRLSRLRDFMNVKTETDQDWAKDVKTETLSKVLLEKNQTSNTAIYNFALILCFLYYIQR